MMPWCYDYRSTPSYIIEWERGRASDCDSHNCHRIVKYIRSGIGSFVMDLDILTDSVIEENILSGRRYRFFNNAYRTSINHGSGRHSGIVSSSNHSSLLNIDSNRRIKAMYRREYPCVFMGSALPMSVLPGSNPFHCSDRKANAQANAKRSEVSQKCLIGYSRPIERLNFEIYSCDGGEFDEAYKVANVLKADQSVYCSQRGTNVNIVMRLAGNEGFNITHAVLKVPESGYTAPVKEGLLFVFHEFPDVEKTNVFNDYNKKMYDQLMAKAASSSTEYDPKAFFRIEPGRTSTVVSFDYPHSGKWVLLKLIRSVRTNAIPRRNWLSIVRSMRRHRQDFVSRISEITRYSLERNRPSTLTATDNNGGGEENPPAAFLAGRDEDYFNRSSGNGVNVEDVREEREALARAEEEAMWDEYTSSENNIDIQFCAFAGFIGNMGFAQADLC